MPSYSPLINLISFRLFRTSTGRQRSPQIATSSPGAGPSTLTSSTTPRQGVSSSTITAQQQPSSQRRRSISPGADDFDRGLPRSMQNQPGRLFNPDTDPLTGNTVPSASTSMVAITSGSGSYSHHPLRVGVAGPSGMARGGLREPFQATEAMSDVSSTGVAPGGTNVNGSIPSPRKPLPARGLRAGTPHAQRSPQMAHSSPRAADPNMPQQQMSATRRLFEPSRDDPLRFSSAMSASSSARPPPPPGFPAYPQHHAPTNTSINNGYISASTSDTRSLASSAFTLSSYTSGTSISTGSFASSPQSVDSNGNPIPDTSRERKTNTTNVTPLVAELKRVYREISEMEKRLLAKENECIGMGDDDMGSRHDLKAGSAMEPGAQEQKWIKLAEAHKACVPFPSIFLSLELVSNGTTKSDLLPCVNSPSPRTFTD